MNCQRAPRNLLIQGSQASPVLDEVKTHNDPPTEVLEALENIKSTRFENSFLSRIYGTISDNLGTLSVDWLSETPWMQLMSDVRDHHSMRW